jgi:hypothetical protein
MKPLILSLFIVIAAHCFGQSDSLVLIENSLPKDTISQNNTDTAVVVKEKKHSPALAGGLSAVLPGLGQAYNKKYWKIPIDYAGFAGAGYLVYHFSTEYIKYRDEYRIRIDKKDNLRNPDYKILDDNNVNAYKLQYQRYMQFSILALTLWYFINILDAVVDAHLMSFDVSSNLALHIAPDISNGLAWGNSYKRHTLGLSFTLNFK